MDEALRVQLDTVALTACEFANARRRRNQRYDWLTPTEQEALANLRTSLSALAREEAKSRSGMAA